MLRRVSALWQFRCHDHRGQERVIPFPSWSRLSRERVPRPIRLSFGAISWRVFALWIVCCTIPMWGHVIGNRIWRELSLAPWLASVKANPGAASGPPSMVPLMLAQFGSIVLMVAAFAAVAPACNRGIARRYVRGMLERARCPWCAYDLSGAQPSDSPTTCPECGGAWRLT